MLTRLAQAIVIPFQFIWSLRPVTARSLAIEIEYLEARISEWAKVAIRFQEHEKWAEAKLSTQIPDIIDEIDSLKEKVENFDLELDEERVANNLSRNQIQDIAAWLDTDEVAEKVAREIDTEDVASYVEINLTELSSHLREEFDDSLADLAVGKIAKELGEMLSRAAAKSAYV